MSDSVTYEYDESGRLKKLVFEDEETTVEVTYDANGNRQVVETTLPE